MKLLNTAVSVGIGYVLAKPEARQKLVELAQHPKVKQLRTQGQDLATSGVRTAKHRLNRSSASPSSGPADPALTEGVLPPADGVGGTRAATAGVTGLPPRPAPAPPTGNA